MNILAVESSCDETAVAVVRDGRTVLADAVASQADMHAIYGGVVPEIASRKHIEAIVGLSGQALEQAGKLRLLRRAFRPKDLEGNRLAVAATGDRGVNRQIAALCRARGILVNVADDQEACTCKFPAVVRRGGLTIGVSTGGASPTAARFFKERIEALIPAGEGELADILDFLARSRAVVRERLPEGARGPVFAALFDRCMALGRGLSGEELEEVLKEAARDE